jgi:hypothetical protein
MSCLKAKQKEAFPATYPRFTKLRLQNARAYRKIQWCAPFIESLPNVTTSKEENRGQKEFVDVQLAGIGLCNAKFTLLLFS